MLGLESIYELSAELILPFSAVLFFVGADTLDISEPI